MARALIHGHPWSAITEFQSRCRDWVVGEHRPGLHLRVSGPVSVSLPRLGGWRVATKPSCDPQNTVSVSLPRLGGWRALRSNSVGWFMPCFSLVAEIGWLASCLRPGEPRWRGIVSVSLPRLGGWRGGRPWSPERRSDVSVSLPRLGGWRGGHRARPKGR